MNVPGAAAGEDEEPKLIAASRAGSRTAFVELVRMHQSRIRSFIGTRIFDRSVADDIAQETFVSAFRGISDFRGDATFRVWLIGIARHRILDHFRAELRVSGNDATALWVARTEVDATESDRSTLSRQDAELDALEDCLARLPEASARAVEEHYFRGRPIVAIARELHKEPGAIRVELFRIRKALRACIDGKVSLRANS
jgi:RNA polymerase sigma-70 factor (ECF subfamily)